MGHRRRIEPGPGQESVWDYPRPPRLEASSEHIVVRHRDRALADSHKTFRVLETSQPPAYYIDPGDVDADALARSTHQTYCEWKGLATCFDVVIDNETVRAAAWTYRSPNAAFAEIRDHLAFYPRLLDECSVDGEQVESNEGAFYGGWVTRRIVGPFKGGPGTAHW